MSNQVYGSAQSSSSQQDQSSFRNREQDSTNKEGKPYLGKIQDPVPTKGLDGSLNIKDIYKYSKNPCHVVSNCKKLDDCVKKGLAKLFSQNKPNQGK